MGKPLSFMPPIERDGQKVVKLSVEDLQSQVDYWANALIGYVIGDNPNVQSIENFVLHAWNFVSKPQILLHAGGYCISRFNSKEDKEMVIQSGPYSYRNKPMVLKPWEIDFSFQNAVLSTVPVWIRFPSLPVGYWSVEVLSKLASAVGKPLYTDKFTAHFEKISFARVLVEVDAAYPLPDQIEIDTPYGMKVQQIEYDWKPSFCIHCLKFGHDALDCWHNVRNDAEVESDEQVKGIRERTRKPRLNPRQKWIAKTNADAAGPEPVQTVIDTKQVEANSNGHAEDVQMVNNNGPQQILEEHGRTTVASGDPPAIIEGMNANADKGKAIAILMADDSSGYQVEPGPSWSIRSNTL